MKNIVNSLSEYDLKSGHNYVPDEFLDVKTHLDLMIILDKDYSFNLWDVLNHPVIDINLGGELDTSLPMLVLLEQCNWLAKIDNESWYVMKTYLSTKIFEDGLYEDCWRGKDTVSFYSADAGTVSVHDPYGELDGLDIPTKNIPWSGIRRQSMAFLYTKSKKCMKLLGLLTAPGVVNTSGRNNAFERIVRKEIGYENDPTAFSGACVPDHLVQMLKYLPSDGKRIGSTYRSYETVVYYKDALSECRLLVRTLDGTVYTHVPFGFFS